MKALYHVWKRAVRPETCARIIEEASHLIEKEAGLGLAEDKKTGKKSSVPTPDKRKSRVRWFPAQTPQYKWLYEYVDSFVQIANKQMFGFDLWPSTPQGLQFTEYNVSGDHYDWHMDTAMQDFVTMEHRKLSCIILLDEADSSTGGEFELELHPRISNEFTDIGDVLVFPSFLKHRIKKLKTGTRRSLVAWSSGPKWR